MTVKEFAEWLSTFPSDAEVRAWDPDLEESVPVTGAVFTAEYVDLQTDQEP
jgi:hypothetical protein